MHQSDAYVFRVQARIKGSANFYDTFTVYVDQCTVPVHVYTFSTNDPGSYNLKVVDKAVIAIEDFIRNGRYLMVLASDPIAQYVLTVVQRELSEGIPDVMRTYRLQGSGDAQKMTFVYQRKAKAVETHRSSMFPPSSSEAMDGNGDPASKRLLHARSILHIVSCAMSRKAADVEVVRALHRANLIRPLSAQPTADRDENQTVYVIEYDIVVSGLRLRGLIGFDREYRLVAHRNVEVVSEVPRERISAVPASSSVPTPRPSIVPQRPSGVPMSFRPSISSMPVENAPPQSKRK